MHIESVSTTQTKASPTTISVPHRLPPLAAAALGLLLIFAAGFAETSALHNAAHDTRHSTGFPCH